MAIKYGDLLKELRLEKGLTQQELAEFTNYSKQHISRIENNEVIATYETAVLFSKILNFDFVKLSKYAYDFESYNDYLAFCKLVRSLEIGCDEQTIEVINEYNINETFNYGILKHIKHYANAVIKFGIDAKECIRYCLEIFDITIGEMAEFDLDSLIDDYQYGVFVALTCGLDANGDKHNTEIATIMIYDHFEKIMNVRDNSIEYSWFLKKLHPIIINNFANLKFKKNDYEQACELCDKAIKKASEYNMLYKLHNFYKLKMESTYMLGKIEDARKYFEYTKMLCEINDKESYFDSVIKLVEEKYNLILETH